MNADLTDCEGCVFAAYEKKDMRERTSDASGVMQMGLDCDLML